MKIKKLYPIPNLNPVPYIYPNPQVKTQHSIIWSGLHEDEKFLSASVKMENKKVF
jgi:hypothetical protein